MLVVSLPVRSGPRVVNETCHHYFSSAVASILFFCDANLSLRFYCYFSNTDAQLARIANPIKIEGSNEMDLALFQCVYLAHSQAQYLHCRWTLAAGKGMLVAFRHVHMLFYFCLEWTKMTRLCDRRTVCTAFYVEKRLFWWAGVKRSYVFLHAWCVYVVQVRIRCTELSSQASACTGRWGILHSLCQCNYIQFPLQICIDACPLWDLICCVS